jgi:hypothetical protein
MYRNSVGGIKMRNLLIALFCVICVVSAFAQDAVAPVAPVADVVAPVAVVEYNGIIEVTPAAEGKTEATVVLDMGEKSYQLIAADAEKLAALVALEGKTVTVKGEVVVATEAEALDTLKVESCVETAAAATEAPVEGAPDVDDAPDAE